MPLNDDAARKRAMHEMLEAFSSGMAGAFWAPMPGLMFEMLEIAARQRQEPPPPDRYRTK